jgi:hypothetical protein
MDTAILAPAAALAVWSMVMLLWMAATRLPALAKLKMDSEQSRGKRGVDLDGVLPASIQWKSHNYNHLMEQPTIFYAVVIMFALVGSAEQFDIWLAWAYLVLRVVHSLWQALVNTIPVRLTLFTISSIILTILAVRLLLAFV